MVGIVILLLSHLSPQSLECIHKLLLRGYILDHVIQERLRTAHGYNQRYVDCNIDLYVLTMAIKCSCLYCP